MKYIKKFNESFFSDPAIFVLSLAAFLRLEYFIIKFVMSRVRQKKLKSSIICDVKNIFNDSDNLITEYSELYYIKSKDCGADIRISKVAKKMTFANESKIVGEIQLTSGEYNDILQIIKNKK